jgi:hypothetical protein
LTDKMPVVAPAARVVPTNWIAASLLS